MEKISKESTAKFTEEDRKLHQRFSEYGLNAREWMRKCALLLPEIARREIWKKKKCGSIYEYAAKLAGMSRSSVDQALFVLRKIESLPALKAVVEVKGIQSIRPVVNVATPETQEFWAEKAKEMSKHTLETYVKDFRSSTCPGANTQPERAFLTLNLKLELVRKLEQLKKRVDFEDLLKEFVEKIEAKVEAEKPAAKESYSRYIPAKIKAHVLENTGGKCAYPSCSRTATSLHHTQRFALEKTHDPDRLQPVCTAHERLAHIGLIENEESAPEKWGILEKPDPLHHKNYIDRMVQGFRGKALQTRTASP